mgnify:FL=1
MEFKKFEGIFVLRLDSGEEIVQSLLDFCMQQKIFAGTIFGIGSTQSATLAFFDEQSKKYDLKTFLGMHEIAALSGNISLKDDKAYVHCHITLGDKKFNAFAGRLKSAIVGPTCEITIFEVKGKVLRKHSEKTGLNLYSFD